MNAIITATPNSGKAPLEVTFDASESSSAEGNEIMSYKWDFEDGNTGEGQTIQHGFGSPGNYTIILTINDNKGFADTSSLIITVFQPTETVMEQNFNTQNGTEFDTGIGVKIIVPPILTEEQMKLEVKYNSNPSQSASDLIKLHSNYSITITPQKGFQKKELMTSGMNKYQETTQISLIFDVPEDVDPQSLAIFEWTDEGWCLAGAGDIGTIEQLGGVLSLNNKYISIEVPVENSLSTPAAANINMFGIGNFVDSIGNFVDNVLDSLLKVCPIITPGSELEFINGGDYIEKEIYFQSYNCEVFGSGQGIPYKVGILNNSNNLIVNDDYQPDWNQSYSGPYQILGSFELSDQSIGYLMPSDDESEKGVLTLRFGSEGGECTVWLEADGVMLLEMWLLSLIPGVEISATLADIFEMYIRNAGNYLMGDSVDTIRLFEETVEMLKELTIELFNEGISHVKYGSSMIPVGKALTLGFKSGNLMKRVATYLYMTSSSQNPCGCKSPGYWEKKIEVEPVNKVPVVSITSPTEGSTYTEGETINFDGEATDPEDGVLSGDSLFWSLPSGKIIGTGESFSKNDLSVGTYVITLNAVDSQSRKGEYSVTINVTEQPDLRVNVVSLSKSSAQVGDTISVTFAVNNNGGPVSGVFKNRVFLSTTQYGGGGQKIPLEDYSMSLDGISSKTEMVNVVIPQVPAGDWYIGVFTDATKVVQEENEDNNINSAPIHIGTNHAPIITSNPVTVATKDKLYSYDVDATDADGDTRTYSLTTNKPSGMIINPSTGLITWTPTATGDYNVTVKVSDGIVVVTQEFTITVASTVTNQAPYIPNNPSPTDNSLGVLVNTDLGWSGGDPDPEDTVTYDVYFEANDSTPDKLVSNDQSNTTYDPGILNYNTHYYWKIIAKDNHGKETPGPVWNFITESQINNPPNPPNVPSGPSSGITGTSYSFSTSTTDPDGDNIAYMLDWGDGNISNWTSYVSSGNIVNQLHSYSTKGTYYIKVKAKDVNGAESLWSNSHKIIIELEITKPVVPSKLSATTLSQNNIALIWQDNADNETGFKIERKTGTTGAFIQIATIGATAGSGSGVYYEDFGLVADTTYCYRVKAYNSAGDSLDSNQDCDTTKPITILPSATTGSATNVTFNSAMLNGTVNPNGVETGAFFQWGINTSYGNITDSQFLGSGTSNVNISANLTGLSPNTIYHFRIVATNSAGGTTYGEDRVFTTPPSPSLTFTGLTPSQISTSASPYQATLSATGNNFNNVNRVSFSWSGAASGSATWYKGDTNWNTKVTVNSDTSMTLKPGVVETNPTWSGKVYWTVTLRDTTGAMASRSFTVTYTPKNKK